MESQASVYRRWERTILVVVCLYAVGFAWAIGLVYCRHAIQMEWYRRVEFLILRLARKKPDDVSAAQWSQCLHHTWNLHVNFGPPGYFAENSRGSFAAEFERRLENPVGLDAIDWIWDEFERNAPRAKSYDHYRPTTPSMLERAAELEQRTRPESLDSWVKRLEERERAGK